MVLSPDPTPLVGRELDLALALEQLKRIQHGSPAALLIRGVAGIGKSRLAAEVLTRAGQLGHLTLVGRADELDRGIPYAVFRDLLSRLALDEPDRERLRDDVETFRAALDGSGQAEEDQLSNAFTEGVRLLRAVAALRPTVLLVEDAHLADRESLALAGALVRLADVPVLSVVTTRPDNALSADVEHLLERMTDDGRGATIDLQPLDRHETTALASAALSGAPDAELAQAVFSASKGNPFFVREAVRSLTDTGDVVVEQGRARLAAGSPVVSLTPSTALLRRLFHAQPEDVELAKVIAVFGRFALHHLALVERLTGGDAAASFDRLVKAGVLAPTTDGGYEFTHSIVRNTLYDDIGPAERRRLHGAIAAELGRPTSGAGLLEAATHVAASAAPGDEDAARLLLDAGRAVAATAPLVASEYHRRAIELIGDDSPLRHEALAFRARSLHVAGRAAEAAAVGLAALADLPPSALRRATAASVVNDLWLSCQVEEARHTLAVELESGGDLCPLLAQQVDILLQTGRAELAAELLPAAVRAIAGPPSIQLFALTHLLQYANHVGQLGLAADLRGRLAALPHGASASVALAVHEVSAFTDWRPGMLARVEAHLEAAQQLRPDAVLLSVGGGLASARARVLLMRGEWDEALALIRSASFDLAQRGIHSVAQLMLAAGAEMHIDRGDVDEAAAWAAQLVTPMEALRRSALLVQVRLRRALGEREAAYALLREEPPVALGESLWKRSELLWELCDLLVEDTLMAEARDVAAELEEVARRTGWLESLIPALRAKAVVHQDVAAAKEYAAVAEHEGWLVEQARAALVLGELEVDAADDLALAYRLFERFGAAPWRRRAAAGLRARGRTVPRRPAQPRSALTETEEQLVRLVHEGLSNQQIATAMHYSTKTIEVYLSRVYTKTGCSSRLELIRAVDSGALTPG